MKKIILDEEQCSLHFEGHEVQLSPMQLELIKYLSANQYRTASYYEIIRRVWFGSVSKNTVTGVVRDLRLKISELGIDPRLYLKTVHGYGYRLENVDLASKDQMQEMPSIAISGESNVVVHVHQPVQAPEKTLATSFAEPVRSQKKPTYTVDWDKPEPPANPWDTLTKREWDIFLQLGDRENVRLTCQELAKKWPIQESTFKSHLKSIYRKLEVKQPKRRHTIQLARRALAGHSLVLKQEVAA